jgi:hypothetical protein
MTPVINSMLHFGALGHQQFCRAFVGEFVERLTISIGGAPWELVGARVLTTPRAPQG